MLPLSQVGVDIKSIFLLCQFLARSSASAIGLASRPAQRGYVSISSIISLGIGHDASLPGLCAPSSLIKPPGKRKTLFLLSASSNLLSSLGQFLRRSEEHTS